MDTLFHSGPLNIASIADPVASADFARLCELLAACVHAGASIGFVEPLDKAEVEEYWHRVCREAAQKSRLILVARESAEGPIVGTAQLAFESKPNGRHRAEVQKVMVFPEHRRKRLAAALMAAVEAAARSRSLKLLFLDTSDGHGGAREFYAAIGYTYVGGIPGYAVDPDGKPAWNAIYYKELA